MENVIVLCQALGFYPSGKALGNARIVEYLLTQLKFVRISVENVLLCARPLVSTRQVKRYWTHEHLMASLLTSFH